MNKKLALLLAAGALVAGAQQSQAVTISGTIDIGAFQSHVVVDKNANTVDFVDDNLATPGNALVNNATGDFEAYLLQAAIYQDFTYSPLTIDNPLWTLVIGAASFDLQTITFINEAGSGLVLNGTGIIHAAGYDDTFGTWSFSADTAVSGSASFTFSSQTAAAVPDGGATAMLLGVGVLGLAGLRRKVS